MSKFDPKAIRDASDFPARLRELEARVKSLETSSGLDSASFSGTLRVAPGGEFVVDGGADITMNGGGLLQGNDGSGIQMMHPGNQKVCAFVGTLATEAGTGYGIFANATSGEYLFVAAENQSEKFVSIGDPQDLLDRTVVHSSNATVNTHGGYIWLNADNGNVIVSNIPAGTGDDLRIDSGGRLFRVTSSSRYKQDIEDADVDAGSVLQLRARQWRYKQQVADSEVVAPAAFGFIAEEVDEAGLSAAVTRNADGEPDGLDYHAILAATVELCKRQQAEINELRSRIDAMEAGQNTSL